MTDSELEQLIRAWYRRGWLEGDERKFEAGLACPPFSRFWRHIAEGDPLGEYAAHVPACNRCDGLARVIQRELAPTASPAQPIGLRARTWGVVARSAKVIHQSRLLRGGLAAAILLVILMTLIIRPGHPALAEDMIQTINGQFIFDGPFPDLEVLSNPEEVKMRWARILAAAQELGELKEKAAREADRPEEGFYPAGEAMHAWTHVYRGLRDLGQWDLAIQEMHKALKYPGGWPAVVLHDLGQTYAMMGAFGTAREWYQRSIDARKAKYGRPEDHERPQPRKETGYVSSLAPLYWRLTDIALVEGDLEEARRALSEAERLLREYFTTFATAAGVVFPPDAELLQVYRTLPAEFGHPAESTPDHVWQAALERYGIPKPEATQVAQIREHLLRVARLRRAEGDLAAATAALDEAATIPFYPIHEESRLDFSEPFERARIAIAERDFTAALAHLQNAANHVGPVVAGAKNPAFLTIGPQLRAQLQVLRGLALLGLDPSSAEGRAAVEGSWAVVQKLSEAMKPPERETFMRQFGGWKQLIERGN